MAKLLLINIFLIISLAGFMQSKVVDLSNFDSEKLNQLLVDYTNQLRLRKRKNDLSHYPSLDKAAKNHAEYMAKRNYLGHYQKIRSLKTVKDRVKQLGGNADFVGENVQYISINYEIEQAKSELTYQQLAKILGDHWKKSKGHYANMIDANYQGVSHQFAIKNGLLYACQVFSSKPFEPVFDYQIGAEFTVKNKKPCQNCKATIKKYNRNGLHYGWYRVSNDSLFYYNYKKTYSSKQLNLGSKTKTFRFKSNNLSKIFSKRGKLSVDFIHLSQFGCNENPAYHPALNYDGYYLGFIDKKKIKEDNISKSPDFVQLYIGQIPEVEDEHYQVDFFLTKKNRPCSQQSLVFIGPDYFKPWEFFQLQHPNIKVGEEQVIKDSIIVKVPFSRNKTNEDQLIFSELLSELQRLKNDSATVTELRYTGVASIEGTEKINRSLIAKRASVISEILKSYYPNLLVSHQLIENFDGFKIALQDLNKNKWQNASNTELRDYANKNKNKDKIAQILNETRQSEVTIYIKHHFSTVQLSPTLKNLDQLIKKQEYTASLLVWQQLTRSAIKGDSLLAKDLVALEIPKDRSWQTMHWEQFVLDLKLNETPVTADRLSYLHDIGAISSDGAYLEYRLLFNLFYNREVFPVTDYEAVRTSIKSKTLKNWLESLYLINEFEFDRPSSPSPGALLAKLAASGRFNAYQTYLVCQYIMQYDRPDLAFALLNRYAKQPHQFTKLYQQYLKLSYYFYAFDDTKQFKTDLIVLRNFAKADAKAFCVFFKWFHIGVRGLENPLISSLYCQVCS